MSWMKIAATAAGVAIVACLLLFRMVTQVPTGPAALQTFSAKVVRFGGIPSKWQADKIIVVASTPDGRTGQGVLASARVQELDCKIGSPVSAHMAGSVMIVDALTCGKGGIALSH
jgi:hypothetical protein